jgi:hypothetical protein
MVPDEVAAHGDQIGRLFTLGSFSKITSRSRPKFCSTLSVYILKNGLGYLWVIISQTNLVTLLLLAKWGRVN